MRKSKLEKYLDILKVLAHRGSLELKQIAGEADITFSVRKGHLDFLIQQNLVKEQPASKGKVSYALTERGVRVLNVALPIVEEAHKISALLS